MCVEIPKCGKRQGGRRNNGGGEGPTGWGADDEGRMSDPQSRSGGGHCHGITKGGDGEEKLGQ